MTPQQLAQEIRNFRKTHKIENGFGFNYQDWYDWRMLFSHQQATRGDEKWFARAVGGSTEGTGKQWWEPFNREVDIGDGFVGSALIAGTNNYDLKVTYKERAKIDSVGFQPYRPADPIAFYAALIGAGPRDYTLIIVPKDVAFKMKVEKIAKTGKLGSAHGTGLYDKMSTDEKINVLVEANRNGKSCVIGFDVKQSSDKENFELLMDKYRMRLEDVSTFISNYKP